MDDISKREEPNAWIKKYLIAASVSCDENFLNIRGINDNKFNSNAIQINNHCEADNAITTDVTSVKENKVEKGNINKGKELNFPRSS